MSKKMIAKALKTPLVLSTGSAIQLIDASRHMVWPTASVSSKLHRPEPVGQCRGDTPARGILRAASDMGHGLLPVQRSTFRSRPSGLSSEDSPNRFFVSLGQRCGMVSRLITAWPTRFDLKYEMGLTRHYRERITKHPCLPACRRSSLFYLSYKLFD